MYARKEEHRLVVADCIYMSGRLAGWLAGCIFRTTLSRLHGRPLASSMSDRQAGCTCQAGRLAVHVRQAGWLYMSGRQAVHVRQAGWLYMSGRQAGCTCQAGRLAVHVRQAGWLYMLDRQAG